MAGVKKVAEHVRKYFIWYTIVVILLAVFTGPRNSPLLSMNKQSYSILVEILAIATILPSMITLKLRELTKVAKMWKETVLSLAYVYIVTPLLSWLLSLMIDNKMIALGFFAANIVPSGSSALGYVMLASGNIELATVIVILMIPLCFITMPAYLALYASVTSVKVPIAGILESLAIVLLTPLFVGQLIKYYLVKAKGESYINKELSPHLSLSTLITILLLIYVLIAKKSLFILSKPWIATEIIIFLTVLILVTIPILIFIDKSLGIHYSEHQAITFTVITKNASIAAAIAASSLGGGLAAVPAGLVPSVQPVLAVVYLHMEEYVRRIFAK